MKTIFDNINITEYDADILAMTLRELAEDARQNDETFEDGVCVGRLQGFVGLAVTLGIMPAITMAGNRLQRQREITEALTGVGRAPVTLVER